MQYVHYILMADIISSSSKKGNKLMMQFRELVSYINHYYSGHLLSPLTITLGDEFQGVIASQKEGLEIILRMEERIVETACSFRLRYVFVKGRIDTPLNPKNAHGMLGPGLKSAREELGQMKARKYNRFYFALKPATINRYLDSCFTIFEELADNWSPKDYALIALYIKHKDYKKVAAAADRDISLTWRRKKSLRMESYFSIKKLILNAPNPD